MIEENKTLEGQTNFLTSDTLGHIAIKAEYRVNKKNARLSALGQNTKAVKI